MEKYFFFRKWIRVDWFAFRTAQCENPTSSSWLQNHSRSQLHLVFDFQEYSSFRSFFRSSPLSNQKPKLEIGKSGTEPHEDSPSFFESTPLFPPCRPSSSIPYVPYFWATLHQDILWYAVSPPEPCISDWKSVEWIFQNWGDEDSYMIQKLLINNRIVNPVCANAGLIPLFLLPDSSSLLFLLTLTLNLKPIFPLTKTDFVNGNSLVPLVLSFVNMM